MRNTVLSICTAIALTMCPIGQTMVFADNVPDSEIKESAKEVGKATKDAAKEVGKETKKVSKKVAKQSKKAAKKVKKTSKKVGKDIKKGFNEVKDSFKD